MKVANVNMKEEEVGLVGLAVKSMLEERRRRRRKHP